MRRYFSWQTPKKRKTSWRGPLGWWLFVCSSLFWTKRHHIEADITQIYLQPLCVLKQQQWQKLCLCGLFWSFFHSFMLLLLLLLKVSLKQVLLFLLYQCGFGVRFGIYLLVPGYHEFDLLCNHVKMWCDFFLYFLMLVFMICPNVAPFCGLHFKWNECLPC